jgi:hypothetical protein
MSHRQRGEIAFFGGCGQLDSFGRTGHGWKAPRPRVGAEAIRH